MNDTDTPVAATGKISDPDDVERLLASGQVDIVGIGLAKEKYQLDLAVDHVLDGATTLILAMIHYF